MARTSLKALVAGLPTMMLLCGNALAVGHPSAAPLGADGANGDLAEMHQRLSELVGSSVQGFQSRQWGVAAAAAPASPVASDAGPVTAAAAAPQLSASVSAQAAAKMALQTPIVVHAGMAIDNDGVIANKKAAATARRDPCHQSQTSFRYKDGKSLDPSAVPFVVVPRKYKHMLGDFAVVQYKGKSVAAMVGDVGPRFGEGSVALAEALGVNSDGVKGGVGSGVTYTFYPGSKPGPMADQGQLTQAMANSSPALIADASSRASNRSVAGR